MLRIIRFFKGFLIIGFSGENAEKILNLCSVNGIVLWNTRCRKGYITTCISIKDFKKLRIIKRKIKTRIRIIKKCGLPLKKIKIITRPGMISGLVLGMIFLRIMSLYVWDVNVCGNSSLNTKDIIGVTKSLGIDCGVLKNKIDTLNLPQDIVLEIPQISWCAVNIEGSRLTVDITEVSKQKEKSNSPCNIVAKCDGIITKVKATSGTVMVRPGDVVVKGQVLISGINENLTGNVFVEAKGEIVAKTVHKFKSTKEYEKMQTNEIGKTKTKKLIKLLNINIPLFINDNKDYKVLKTKEKQLNFFGKKIPVIKYYIYYKNTTSIKKKISGKTLEKEFIDNIDKKLKNSSCVCYELTEFYAKNGTDSITLDATYNCEEKIGKVDAIIMDVKN